MPELDCSNCSLHQKKERGCEEDTIVPVSIMGEDSYRCPRRPILEDSAAFSYYLRLYRQYRQGTMPEPGGMLEQCALTMDIFSVLDQVYYEVEKHQAEERHKERNRNQFPGQVGSSVSSRG